MSEKGMMELLPTNETLAKLAETIQTEVAKADSDFHSAVGHAINAGEGLIEAKSLVKHGEWEQWIKDNFAFSAQTARTYMRVAENKSQVESALSISEAVRMIAPPERYPSPEPPQLSVVPNGFPNGKESLDSTAAEINQLHREVTKSTKYTIDYIGTAANSLLEVGVMDDPELERLIEVLQAALKAARALQVKRHEKEQRKNGQRERTARAKQIKAEAGAA